MSSRSKITKFCKENNVEIISLKYERGGQHIYGDYSDESEWVLDFKIKTSKGNWYNGLVHGYTADECIVELIDEINNPININKLSQYKEIIKWK